VSIPSALSVTTTWVRLVYHLTLQQLPTRQTAQMRNGSTLLTHLYRCLVICKLALTPVLTRWYGVRVMEHLQDTMHPFSMVSSTYRLMDNYKTRTSLHRRMHSRSHWTLTAALLPLWSRRLLSLLDWRTHTTLGTHWQSICLVLGLPTIRIRAAILLWPLKCQS